MPMTTAVARPTTQTTGLLTRMREIVPRRGLSPAEARQVAERQAAILLNHAGIDKPAVPESIVTDQPFLAVTRRPGFPTSGMATQTDTGLGDRAARRGS